MNTTSRYLEAPRRLRAFVRAHETRVAYHVGKDDRSEVTLRCLPHGQQGYPFAVQVDVTYRLDAESGLHVTVTATNKGSRPAPWGTGAHPYLTAGTQTIDDCELELPADRWQPDSFARRTAVSLVAAQPNPEMITALQSAAAWRSFAAFW